MTSRIDVRFVLSTASRLLSMTDWYVGTAIASSITMIPTIIHMRTGLFMAYDSFVCRDPADS
jgi:hypothetical protein